MTGSFRGDDEIRAELDRTRADIEQTRADIQHTRAELAQTVAALSLEMRETRRWVRDAGESHVDSVQWLKDPTSGTRPIAKIAQGAKPAAVRAAGDMKRAALSAASLLWLLVVLRRRRHRR
jgi:hypothetical protein